MAIAEFIQQYFISPLYVEVGGYNIYNTLAYGVILALVVFLVYKVLKKLKIPIDTNFFIAALPYIFLASVLRVLHDAGILKSVIFVAPILYITDFAIAFSILLATFYLSKQINVKYYLQMFIVGIVLLVISSSKLEIVHLTSLLQILAITTVFIGVLHFFSNYKPDILTPMNSWILSAAMFDATSTFVGVAWYGYLEKHVLPNFLFGIAGGAWIMFPLKFFVILLALYVIDMQADVDDFFKNFLKFAILTVTLGPGARNTLRLMMGV